MIVEVKKLVKRFGNLVAVNNVSFEIEAGRVYGFVGPNGAGKTTTMRIMATLEDPNSGDVRIAGYSVLEDPEKVRAIMGFMPDQYETYPNMTVWEFLDFYARCYGMRHGERMKTIASIMDFVELNELSQKEVNTLSKGMRQRLCLGKTLLHNPGIILMDEPAAGLDPRARIKFRELVKILAGDQGKTIFISSHILTELEEMVDGVAIIEQGKILADGKVSDILKNIQAKMEIEISFAGDPAGVERVLLETPGVIDPAVSEKSATFQFTGGAEEQSALHRKLLLDESLKLLEFKKHEQNLEDLFMTITKGKVQ